MAGTFSVIVHGPPPPATMISAIGAQVTDLIASASIEAGVVAVAVLVFIAGIFLFLTIRAAVDYRSSEAAQLDAISDPIYVDSFSDIDLSESSYLDETVSLDDLVSDYEDDDDHFETRIRDRYSE